jgi:hypothetical protein
LAADFLADGAAFLLAAGLRLTGVAMVSVRYMPRAARIQATKLP